MEQRRVLRGIDGARYGRSRQQRIGDHFPFPHDFINENEKTFNCRLEKQRVATHGKSMNRIINLFSDTQTQPSRGMRQAMAEAEVGDEQMGLDPCVNALCARVAGLLGYEAALFAPSGTMCNQISVLTHCQAGDEIICDASSHIMNTEGAGAAALAGSAVRAIATETGIFSSEQVLANVRPVSRTGPRTRLVSVEQTVNFTGGKVWSLEQIRGATTAAKSAGLNCHLDGARLMNAVIASGVSAEAFAGGSGFDSAWIDLSKGLGCPVGAVLCGSASFIEEAWRWKYRLGGGMRQAGILAAAGLYALDHQLDRLAEDHGRARRLAERLARIAPELTKPEEIETNIVMINTGALGLGASEFAAACRTQGLIISVLGPERVRAVTHIDIEDRDIYSACEIVSRIAGKPRAAAKREAAKTASVN
jgi:threonine aldolase